jgi:hypothetical protein
LKLHPGDYLLGSKAERLGLYGSIFMLVSMCFYGKAGCFAPGESPVFDKVKNNLGCRKDLGNKFTAFKIKSSQKQKLKLFFVD